MGQKWSSRSAAAHFQAFSSPFRQASHSSVLLIPFIDCLAHYLTFMFGRIHGDCSCACLFGVGRFHHLWASCHVTPSRPLSVCLLLLYCFVGSCGLSVEKHFGAGWHAVGSPNPFILFFLVFFLYCGCHLFHLRARRGRCVLSLHDGWESPVAHRRTPRCGVGGKAPCRSCRWTKRYRSDTVARYPMRVSTWYIMAESSSASAL